MSSGKTKSILNVIIRCGPAGYTASGTIGAQGCTSKISLRGVFAAGEGTAAKTVSNAAQPV
ncbi:hypothetical protein [Paeniglutamicibacter kerguelensis]|uniref:Uncharacterized protein n=1 Tax=Paeniglutamicibacter kerguelensis TaxID=254788 RepID=A0ABS4XCG9_9MICC|nr:hypothetical protein [Paeniglutamicibacter kerguelensis]MBP2385976.1 hypothetical protein [Paeniglutamicibacter kerguelensis]